MKRGSPLNPGTVTSSSDLQGPVNCHNFASQDSNGYGAGRSHETQSGAFSVRTRNPFFEAARGWCLLEAAKAACRLQSTCLTSLLCPRLSPGRLQCIGTHLANCSTSST
jgi:hypothetical protein